MASLRHYRPQRPYWLRRVRCNQTEIPGPSWPTLRGREKTSAVILRDARHRHRLLPISALLSREACSRDRTRLSGQIGSSRNCRRAGIRAAALPLNDTGILLCEFDQASFQRRLRTCNRMALFHRGLQPRSICIAAVAFIEATSITDRLNTRQARTSPSAQAPDDSRDGGRDGAR
jgi:hypothetical protein